MKNTSCCSLAAIKYSFFMESLFFFLPLPREIKKEAEIKRNFDKQLEILICYSSIFY